MKAAVAIIASLFVGAAAADSGLMPAPASNDVCVKLLPGAPASPTYPPEKYEVKQGGLLRVELEFKDADSPPTVRPAPKQRADYSTLLFEAVERFAHMYRNTCMKAGAEPVRVEQDFDFVPNDGRKVTWTTPDAMEEHPETPARCYEHVRPGSKPEYPMRAIKADASGRVVVRVRFEALNEPPKVALAVPPARRELGRAVLDFAQGYRLRCGSPPVQAFQIFDFHLEDGTHPMLKDTDLLAFLGATRNVKERPVFFDLNSMGCPFDVRMRYWQPFMRNDVGEVGEARAERRTFLGWLAGLQLDISKNTASDVAGEELTITIPCGTVDL